MAFKLNPNASSFVPKFVAPKPTTPTTDETTETTTPPQPVESPTTTTTTTTTTTSTKFTESELPTQPTESVFKVEDDDLEDDDDEDVDQIESGVSKATIKDLPEDSREHVNIVFLGHVDAGKSTISGNIMLLTGQVDAHTLAKYEREAKENHRESWIFAYIMDTNEEERTKGKTVEVGRAHFETEKKRYTILDAPGHRNYVPNMIIGAAQADVAILVISSKKGEFEAGVDGGQTIEHARLAKMIGIKYLLVLVNKMDEPSVMWSKERYDEITEKITGHLKKCGYNPKKDFSFIPGSGYTSANIKDPLKPGVCSWYSGPSVIGTLDELPSIERNIQHPLRVPLSSSYKDRGMLNAIGKIESGTISVGQSVLIMPQKIKTEVLALTGDICSFKTAKPGENITITLKGVEEEVIKQGSVISEIPRPVPCVSEIEATVILLDLPNERKLFTADFEAVFHAHSAVEEVKVKRLLALVDMKTGNDIKKEPPYAKVGDSVKCRLVLNKPICLEEFSMNPQLSRFTLREGSKTIAFGKVTSIGKKAKEAYLAAVAAAGK
ncbi:eukaryotic release factor 3 [Tieghemostelium lacteum]|uniref:Eukaryotic release factor 3 n=1 Tax=Tieghemostelium lacteum TaxID=361077 RepID=A0A151Z9Q1_TIELA|nr:eukaryotic release factor 3 [Tieghemostelium lacteum]|eukprot:KYQ90680.1 eukaryotic release factor 3 [Tieghemostelium lacteum]